MHSVGSDQRAVPCPQGAFVQEVRQGRIGKTRRRNGQEIGSSLSGPCTLPIAARKRSSGTKSKFVRSAESGSQASTGNQYVGSDGSTSLAQARMPPERL